MAQQESSEPPESCASPLWDCIWPHGDWVVACAHSAAPEESMAHTESGTSPAVNTLNASPSINSLRIDFYSSTQGSCALSKQVRVFRRHAL
jgi:hypothetical protein